MATVEKKRCWAFVIYPESAPKNWEEILRISGLLCAVSPLHDKDLNPDNTPKKPHWHVIVVYNGPTTFSAVSKFSATLNGTIPIPLESVRGMYRYHIHIDNPEKAQYSDRDRLLLNGFNISDMIELSKSEVDEMKRKIISIVREVGITEYADLLDFLADNELWGEHSIAMNHTIFFNSYIASRRYKTEAEKREREKRERDERVNDLVTQ